MAERNLELDWKKWYSDHLTALEGSSKLIQDGDVVWVGQGPQIPFGMLDELNAHVEDYHNVFFIWNCSTYPFDLLTNPESKGHVRMTSMFDLIFERMSQELGIMENSGNGYDHIYETLMMYGCNTFAVHILPPDENGWCNFGHYGCSNGNEIIHMPGVKKKIAFIDKTGVLPIHGERDHVSVHISEFDYILEADTEMIEFPEPLPTASDKKIAANIAPYIHEGDKLEIGWGGIGLEVLKNLKGTGTYEIFSEVFCDSMAKLCEEGVLTSITACSPAACTPYFFEFASRDNRVNLISMLESINLDVIDKQENLVAINSTFMVDLIGQACSEAQGLKPYSGAGGSLAYIYGAMRAPGGRSFVNLRSTFVDPQGKLRSNIVPWLPAGSIVTTPKNIMMYIVTEWGVADVFLKTLPDRIRALIKIAHPKFRKWLRDEIATTPMIFEADFAGYQLYDNLAPEDIPTEFLKND
ncbi:MAG: acetyl-CoA hydrolase/transferase C-terminal domain-containing protein [Oscillospiraceae bacterium]